MALILAVIGYIGEALHHFRIRPFQSEEMALLSGLVAAFGLIGLIIQYYGKHK